MRIEYLTRENHNKQVSKNIFNKNDNNVGLLRTVKKVWIQEEHRMSHTYNLSHACLSHTHTVKHPTSVALSIGLLCTDVPETLM